MEYPCILPTVLLTLLVESHSYFELLTRDEDAHRYSASKKRGARIFTPILNICTSQATMAIGGLLGVKMWRVAYRLKAQGHLRNHIWTNRTLSCIRPSTALLEAVSPFSYQTHKTEKMLHLYPIDILHVLQISASVIRPQSSSFSGCQRLSAFLIGGRYYYLFLGTNHNENLLPIPVSCSSSCTTQPHFLFSGLHL